MKGFAMLLGCMLLGLMIAVPAMPADIPSEVTLFRNVNVFDGKSDKLLMGYDVLVVENLIKKIDKNIRIADTYEIDVTTGGYKEVDAGEHAHNVQGYGNKVVMVYEPEEKVKKEVKVEIIDGKGRTLMPGLIDAHWHSMYAYLSQSQLLTSNVEYIAIAAAKGAGKTLMRGFTTVRDAGGNSFGVKKATDEGLIPGPRMYQSGAPISQTSGHFDFRGLNDVPANTTDPLTYAERNNIVMVADGVPEVIKRVREQLRLGATQIKLAAGGGVSSSFDPIDVAEYTFEELKRSKAFGV